MMRFAIPAAALALLTLPALAQTTPPAATDSTAPPPASSAPAPAPSTSTTPSPSAQAPASPAPTKKMVGHRQSLAQRFAAANTTHDGQLTKDQATAAKWSYVTRHFAAMDSGNKGYVTVDDIRAYAKAQHVAHRHPAPAPAAPAAPASPPAQTNG